MQVYDLADATLHDTSRAAIVCDFPGCDPFFEPYAIRGRTVSFVTRESEQAGPWIAPADRPPGCLRTSAPHGCDLSGDGDSLDTVVHVMSIDSAPRRDRPRDRRADSSALAVSVARGGEPRSSARRGDGVL
jgi:hypothetical protein